MSVDNQEWEGEIHTLIVHSVEPGISAYDPGEIEYEIEHPASCSEVSEYDDRIRRYDCDVAWNEQNVGLAHSLYYSGTRITEPGTYKIQGWGRKYYVWDAWAYEYDAGVGVVNEEGE